MAKFNKVSEETVELFNSVLDETSIPKWVKFTIFSNNKQKELYKIVKSNELVELLSNGINFALILNEEIFDQLTDEQKVIALDESLAGISISDSDVVALEKPNFTTYRGVLEKYGHESIIVLNESVKSLFDLKQQKEDELKAQSKGKRGRKKKE